MASNKRNSSLKAWYSIKSEIDRKSNIAEVSSSTREARMGYRGSGFFQLNRLYASEGVLTIGIGGAPVVGR